ncbi:MAG: hypothetical protein ACI4E1_11370 [Lachnospira sp.]
MEYKKSYLGFVLWMIAFIAVDIGSGFIKLPTVHMTVALFDNIMIVGIFVLSFIIYKTEAVYWYNGTEYEDARDAGSERRKKFALEHMKRFGCFAAGFLIYSIASLLLDIPYGFDIIVAVIGIVAAAISTINIKL